MKYYDLKNNKYIEKEDNSYGLSFLYNTKIGRIFLKIFINPLISNIYAKLMNSKISKIKINHFIKKNNINIDEYEKKDYSSFNDFFKRKIKDNKRKLETGLISVCDSKLSVYEILNNKTFKIKNSLYTISELIGENNNYKYALIFRLCVDDYHHYIFPDNGRIIKTKKIEGVLHTVRPIAHKKNKVFFENTRNITFLDCDSLGEVCYIEVGAMMIGKIVNHKIKDFKKGDEKGYFEFGGSTVIMLLKNKININQKIIDNTKKDIETIVKLGESLE